MFSNKPLNIVYEARLTSNASVIASLTDLVSQLKSKMEVTYTYLPPSFSPPPPTPGGGVSTIRVKLLFIKLPSLLSVGVLYISYDEVYVDYNTKWKKSNQYTYPPHPPVGPPLRGDPHGLYNQASPESTAQGGGWKVRN